jgi:hypothetical protein
MRVIVSEPASKLIEEQGGRLYVWTKRARCCGGLTTLEAAPSPPAGKEFRAVESVESFRLYVPAHLCLPDELHLDVGSRSHRVDAFWNGCAWVA